MPTCEMGEMTDGHEEAGGTGRYLSECLGNKSLPFLWFLIGRRMFFLILASLILREMSQTKALMYGRFISRKKCIDTEM